MVGPGTPRDPGDPLDFYAEEVNAWNRTAELGADLSSLLEDFPSPIVRCQLHEDVQPGDVVYVDFSQEPVHVPDQDGPPILLPPVFPGIHSNVVTWEDDGEQGEWEVPGGFGFWKCFRTDFNGPSVVEPEFNYAWVCVKFLYATDLYCLPIAPIYIDNGLGVPYRCTLESSAVGYPIIWKPDWLDPPQTNDQQAAWAVVDFSAPHLHSIYHAELDNNVSPNEWVSVRFTDTRGTDTDHPRRMRVFYNDQGTGDELSAGDEVTVYYCVDYEMWRILTWVCPEPEAQPAPEVPAGANMQLESPTETTISIQGWWTPMVGTTLGFSLNGFTHSNNLLTYDENFNKLFQWTMDFESKVIAPGTRNINYGLWRYDAGQDDDVLIDSLNVSHQDGNPISSQMGGFISLSYQDELYVQVMNDDDDDNVTMNTLELNLEAY